jgi:hypothetical protein
MHSAMEFLIPFLNSGKLAVMLEEQTVQERQLAMR